MNELRGLHGIFVKAKRLGGPDKLFRRVEDGQVKFVRLGF
jgi:hypothetical protein